MSETVTITKTDYKNNEFTFIVKKEWIDKNPDYKALNTVEMLSKKGFYDSLHSTIGPALIDHKSKIESYFLNGAHLVDHLPEGWTGKLKERAENDMKIIESIKAGTYKEQE